MNLKKADVIAKENKTPLGVFGKSVNNLFETYLCKSIFLCGYGNHKTT